MATGTAEKEQDLGAIAEKDMDTIDRVIGAAWNRRKKTETGMPVGEKHDVHLQIRNTQYRRETPQVRALYHAVTENRSPLKSEYEVETSWTVTVQHEEPKTRKVPKTVTTTNDKGESVSTTEWVDEHYTDYYSTSYEMSRNDILKARYEEVLANGVSPSNHISDLPSLPTAQPRGAYAVSASNGSPSVELTSSGQSQVNWILENGKVARASERPYRDLIESATSRVDSVTNEKYQAALKVPGETKKILVALENEEQALRAAREKLVNYQATDAKSIQTQWGYDKEKDFRDRNSQMISRYNHMITRVVHLAEQVRRETPSLVIEYSLPSYEPQLQQLKAIKEKNEKIIKTTAGTAAAAGTIGLGVTYRQEIMDTVRNLMGYDDRRQRKSFGY